MADPDGSTHSGEAGAQQRRRALADPVARYERMVEIRTAEDRINQLFAEGVVHGTTHLCQGQEALAVGLASVIRPDDVVTATYRGHGVALALGLTPTRMFAEVLGRVGGCTGGVGGSMHLCDPEVGLLPTFAIVGAGLPVAVGAALAFQTQGSDRIAVAVFGDGATNIGAFHESLNLASIWKLPVVFVCDNNMYGEYSRWDTTTPIEDLAGRAAAYGMASTVVDGMDVDHVRSVMSHAVDRARTTGSPTLVEAKTYRFAGHSRSDAAAYRPEGELDRWRRRDPLPVTRRKLTASGTPERRLDDAEARAHEVVEHAVRTAMAMPAPSPRDMFAHVWSRPLEATGRPG